MTVAAQLFPRHERGERHSTLNSAVVAVQDKVCYLYSYPIYYRRGSQLNMKTACMNCHQRVDEKKLKRCSRCQGAFYCSPECQAEHWRFKHKLSCTPHPLLLKDGKIIEPERGSREWFQVDSDKRFSKWAQRWREVFTKMAPVVLDLANHPPDRIKTHCLFLAVRINPVGVDKTNEFCVWRAQVISKEELYTKYPALPRKEPAPDEPGWTEVTYVTMLENHAGESVTVHEHGQKVSRTLEQLADLPKDVSARGARVWLAGCGELLQLETPDAVLSGKLEWYD
ncbi:zinc finger MYND domain-containing protein [Phanerochaete sordida]|uniref:Zinc finger MYND domain-containing protein n=1 Tax=Phanerochaete sordida TaxID=48140 RepID=A0A9P3G4C0_9APHY|nr:zinc finger MYND domain-containing protein [Phanerochaete sordida]